ncbi:hypothetical protein GGX14DRAFT_676169 [Mycena pura]|uniref:Uncharacterized protein n=1 Tax=Mycena pura TaxID=153505 RepID=A0AAD6YKL1_9AGAR|nr:hypothetical protein GGX14DRAFT_676169 [Mycena pura]
MPSRRRIKPLMRTQVQTYLEIKVECYQGAISLVKIWGFHRYHNGFAKFSTSFVSIFEGLGLVGPEIILMIRAYAQYGRPKKLLAFFLSLWFIMTGVALWIISQWVKSVNSFSKLAEASVPSLTSCNVESSAAKSTATIAGYAGLLGMETSLHICKIPA